MTTSLDDLWAELAVRLPGAVTRDVPLAGFTTYKLGGPVAVLVRLRTEADLPVLAAVVAQHRPPLLFVGRGSNLLLADAGFAGLGVVLEGEFEELTIPPDGTPGGSLDGRVAAGGAVPLPVLARRTAAAGRTGLEFYVGIPGSVGGAVRMNAGGHGRETTEVLVHARVADLAGTGEITERLPEALGLAYRHSDLGPTEVVVGAVFRTEADDAEIVTWRREHQPGGANAGSVFANPVGDSAGRLIDAAGLKGFRVGGAVVSDKHANFVQADAAATAADVRALVLEVQRRVREDSGVELRPELRMIGFDA
jgi:UDP-N-acetylmuramate dehydrogenase